MKRQTDTRAELEQKVKQMAASLKPNNYLIPCHNSQFRGTQLIALGHGKPFSDGDFIKECLVTESCVKSITIYQT